MADILSKYQYIGSYNNNGEQLNVIVDNKGFIMFSDGKKPLQYVDDLIYAETEQNGAENTSTPKNSELNAYLAAKSKAKNDAKREIGKKFKVGDTVYLKTKYKISNGYAKKEFVVKKVIYSVNEQIVNILILKRIDNNESVQKYTLNREDCRTLHVKFEHGLEVWPMNLNWIKK